MCFKLYTYILIPIYIILTTTGRLLLYKYITMYISNVTNVIYKTVPPREPQLTAPA